MLAFAQFWIIIVYANFIIQDRNCGSNATVMQTIMLGNTALVIFALI